MEKAKTMTKRNIAVLIVLSLLILAGAAIFLFCYNQEGFIGSRVKNPDAYLLGIEKMNGTDLHTLELREGDVLQIQFETEKGALYMEIKAPDGTTIYRGNGKETTEFIGENIRSHSPEVISERAKEAHFYVAMDGETIIGCGGITGYWGSTEESYLVSIFVLPDYQGKGVGRKIVETLETDEYFRRAWRTEVGSSITVVSFYRKMGYVFKNGKMDPDEFGVVRLEKRKEE